MKNKNGITLIALVISIIVMLILAGVSINAIVGDNGILTRAQNASIMTRYASYKSEFDMNKVGAMIESGVITELSINIDGIEEEFLKYVPNMQEDEREKFEIIAGYLVYKGDNAMEKEAALYVGIKEEYDQELYDVIGKEFAYYVESWEKAKVNGTISAEKLQNLSSRDNVPLSEFAEYANIPMQQYADEFIMDYGYISYLGTNEERLMLLASSSSLRGYIANGMLKLVNYIAPEEGEIIHDEELQAGQYIINDWIIEELGTEGSIKKAAIIGYKGSQKVIMIPDTFQVKVGEETQIIKITTIKGDGTNNIFNTANSSGVVVNKVSLAKGINTIINKGLANLGNNIQCHITYIGKDLTLGNDKSSTNVLGYEGIENTCGSFTFVAPTTGNYTFKLWGASGGDGSSDTYIGTISSEAGLGGYSQGDIQLIQDEQIYVYIGGKGLYGTSNLEDGSGGYNGGGSGETVTAPGFGGGGATDIRFANTKVNESEDYRILVAGGGGGADNYHGTNQARGTGDDGTGGYGGGTISATDKSKWSGHVGFFSGKTTYIATHWAYPEQGMIEWIAEPGRFEVEEDNYVAKGYKLFFGAPGGEVLNINTQDRPHYDMPGGGGGFWGGEASCHNNGGAAGGSAYADIEGKIKMVNNIKGYSGYENGNGAEMLGRYGNGKIIISQ